jgi:hypothetical protein
MYKKVEISFEKTSDNKLKVIISINDKTLLGKKAYLKLYSFVDVKDSRPVNKSKVLHKKKFLISDFKK